MKHLVKISDSIKALVFWAAFISLIVFVHSAKSQSFGQSRTPYNTHTIVCVSDNAGVCYSNGNTIGNSTLTPASNYSLSLSNGTYEILDCYFVWGNSNNHVNNFLLCMWSNTVSGVGNDNTTPNIYYTEKADKFLGSWRFGEYLDANGHPLLSGYPVYFSGSPASSQAKPIITISRSKLIFTMIAKSGDCPGAATSYVFILKLRKLNS